MWNDADKHTKALLLHLCLWWQAINKCSCLRHWGAAGWHGHHGVQPQNTVQSSGSSFQWQTNLCCDVKTNKIAISHRHKHTEARRLIMSYCRSTLHSVHVRALFHMRIYYLTASHILIFCLMRGHLRGGSVLRWKAISCWKMLFTVFTDVSLNCHPVGPAKLWEELDNADRTFFIVTLESMICLHNIMFEECTSCGIYYTNDSRETSIKLLRVCVWNNFPASCRLNKLKSVFIAWGQRYIMGDKHALDIFWSISFYSGFSKVFQKACFVCKQ